MSRDRSGRAGSSPAPLGFIGHDHGRCVEEAIARAVERCDAEALRLTPVRRRALEILLREHRALGAYEVLERLRESGFGAQPPVAYRALDFLVEHGFAHRIERFNAFVACVRSDESHTPAFMICRRCEAVAETVSAPSRGALGRVAREAGFRIERAVIEVEGVCPSCVEGTPGGTSG